jgi:hypothetical protein
MEPEAPIAYVVPSKIVAQAVTRSHSIWLAKPGKGGKPHVQNDMRRIVPNFPFDVPDYPDGWMEKYRERWDLLAE